MAAVHRLRVKRDNGRIQVLIDPLLIAPSGWDVISDPDLRLNA